MERRSCNRVVATRDFSTPGQNKSKFDATACILYYFVLSEATHGPQSLTHTWSPRLLAKDAKDSVLFPASPFFPSSLPFLSHPRPMSDLVGKRKLVRLTVFSTSGFGTPSLATQKTPFSEAARTGGEAAIDVSPPPILIHRG